MSAPAATQDAKIVAVSLGVRHLLYTRSFLAQIYGVHMTSTVRSDSHNCIKTLENGIITSRSKHMHPKIFHVCSLLADWLIG